VNARKAVFLDFDGTYADRGVVPAGHVAAVRAARAAGHLVFLCTGRPKSMLSDRALEAGFDGLVATAGGYVEVEERVVLDRRFPADLAARTLAVLDAHDADYILEAPEALHGRPGIGERLRTLLAGHFADAAGHGGPQDILAELRTSTDLSGASFAKVTIFYSSVPVAAMAEAIGDGVEVLPSSLQGTGDSAGELYLAGVHKAGGMEVVVQHFAMERRDVIAFGDGLNDVEMLEYAGLGVAIDGAHPDVLAAADHVAPGPEEEGLAAAFAALGLI
jgi:Cof subfamily protein (haloacid dehalogenase superfamily)